MCGLPPLTISKTKGKNKNGVVFVSPKRIGQSCNEVYWFTWSLFKYNWRFHILHWKYSKRTRWRYCYRSESTSIFCHFFFFFFFLSFYTDLFDYNWAWRHIYRLHKNQINSKLLHHGQKSLLIFITRESVNWWKGQGFTETFPLMYINLEHENVMRKFVFFRNRVKDRRSSILSSLWIIYTVLCTALKTGLKASV